MPVTDSAVPTRLVVCVDGTSKASDIQTNIHRIYSSIRPGRCTDDAGSVYIQKPLYVPGIGSADDTFSKDRIQASVLGQGYLRQTQDVYEACCKLVNATDEVWLFGFSRGAYVVRAVAGLLNRFGALATAGSPEFATEYKKLRKEVDQSPGRLGVALSPTSSMSSATLRNAPKLRFLGAFDTVKAVNEDPAFAISFNGSIQHMRHAIALNEDRKTLTPECIFPEDFYHMDLRDSKRSFVQAYFMGSHIDMGGSAKRGGLGLYPLQWMVSEAISCGLSFEVGHSTGSALPGPLSVVFPNVEEKGGFLADWTCTTANGISTSMNDIRGTQDRRQHQETYAIKLGSHFRSIHQRRPREIFTANGILRGYCDWAPQGTILHPSIYLLIDEHSGVSLEMKEVKLQRHLEDWRERMLGSQKGVVNTGFWLDEEEDDAMDPGAVRVLVCGNTGVGKSTLVNKTFGVDVTQSSNRVRGIHDCRQEIKFDGRPDLILHDSGGFEAGADDEFLAIEEFLKEKSSAVDVRDRLHVIWFCVDINSPRTLQTATEKLFRAVSKYASDVPIVVVATKKDDFLDIEFGTHRKALKKVGKRFDEEACEQYAELRLRERIETIRSEMQSVPGGRLDACVAVSQEDDESIAQLSKTTSQCFDTDKVRLLYIRAQVTRIDLKIDMALCEVIRRYKRLIREATGSTFAPMGATITRRVSTNAITKKIIDCFGLPTVSAETAIAALNANVWNTLGSNLTLALAEGFQMFGIAASGVVSGIPIWAITGSINASYLVPATCRLFLIMACDLILVLARSFREVAFRASGQPTERDVSAAARNYSIRGYSQHVHRDVKKLVPRRNVLKSFRANDVQKGLDAIFTRYKDKLMEDVDLPLTVQDLRMDSELDDGDSSTEADSLMLQDLKEANTAVAELDASIPIVELDASAPMVELPAEPKRSELAHSKSTTKKPFELAHSLSTVRPRYELGS